MKAEVEELSKKIPAVSLSSVYSDSRRYLASHFRIPGRFLFYRFLMIRKREGGGGGRWRIPDHYLRYSSPLIRGSHGAGFRDSRAFLKMLEDV